LESVAIRNVKGIDKLDLAFPVPDLPDDPDVFVLGSRNGVGKTSILESCTLLLALGTDKHAADRVREIFHARRHGRGMVDLLDLLVRAGAEFAETRGAFSVANDKANVDLKLHRGGEPTIHGSEELRTGTAAEEQAAKA